jgi:hypothetical protein
MCFEVSYIGISSGLCWSEVIGYPYIKEELEKMASYFWIISLIFLSHKIVICWSKFYAEANDGAKQGLSLGRLGPKQSGRLGFIVAADIVKFC